MQRKGTAAYAAEFVGTFMLVLFICLVLDVLGGVSKGQIAYTALIIVGSVHIFVLAMLVASLGDVSGAHFNPAVTIGLLTRRKIAPPDAVVYIVVQLLGGIAAAYLAKALLTNEADLVSNGATKLSTSLIEGKGLSGAAFEAIGTFALTWAVMGTAVHPKGSGVAAPLYIGGALGLAVMAIAPVTGAGFNPARWLGPALSEGEWTDAWAFIVGPVVGAVLAAGIYAFIHPEGDAPEVKLGAS